MISDFNLLRSAIKLFEKSIYYLIGLIIYNYYALRFYLHYLSL